jgi:hypothetical protein
MKWFPFRLFLAALVLAALAPVPTLCGAMKHHRRHHAGKMHKHQGGKAKAEPPAEEPAS